jgi:hypothetical protein
MFGVETLNPQPGPIQLPQGGMAKPGQGPFADPSNKPTNPNNKPSGYSQHSRPELSSTKDKDKDMGKDPIYAALLDLPSNKGGHTPPVSIPAGYRPFTQLPPPSNPPNPKDLNPRAVPIPATKPKTSLNDIFGLGYKKKDPN